MLGSYILLQSCGPLERLAQGKYRLHHIGPWPFERTSGVQKPGLDLLVLLIRLPRSRINLISVAELK